MGGPLPCPGTPMPPGAANAGAAGMNNQVYGGMDGYNNY